jgi:hypothetical protein
VLSLYKISDFYYDERRTAEDTISLREKSELVYAMGLTDANGSQVIYKAGLSLIPITVEIKPKNYSSILQIQITLGKYIDADKDHDTVDALLGEAQDRGTVIASLGEPLTVAYQQ